MAKSETDNELSPEEAERRARAVAHRMLNTPKAAKKLTTKTGKTNRPIVRRSK